MSFEVSPPVVLRGYKLKTKKRLKRALKRLRRGEGRFADDVAEAIERVSEESGLDLEGKVVVPVVLIYRRKDSNKKLKSLFDLARLK